MQTKENDKLGGRVIKKVITNYGTSSQWEVRVPLSTGKGK
jgi:hypothetical protein